MPEEGCFCVVSFQDLSRESKNNGGFLRFPSGHQMLVSSVTDRAAYPPPSFVAISRYHLIAGLRFLIPGFLIDVLNLLKFSPMQLTPISFLYLSFRRNGLPPPRDNVIRYCFTLKQCPLPRGSPEDVFHDGMYYLGVRAGEHRDLLQGNSSLNTGDYKVNYFFVKGPEIELP
ncbi:hypothetical protein ACOSP7_029964 [Xanthoceras sorbifolium]